MKRILGTTAAAVALAVALPHAADAGVSAVGFFTRNPAAAAPEGGFQVANAPDGVVSFGAIGAAEDADTVSKATLTLKESGSQNVNASGAGLRACVAAGTFKAGRGTLADGPKADCQAGEEPLKRDASGVWTAEVTSLLVGDAPAVAVVPAGTSVFQVTFDPPALDVETSGSSDPGSDAEAPFDASEFGGSSGGDTSSGGGTDSSGDFTGGSSGFGDTPTGSFGTTDTGSSFGSSGSTSFDAGATATGGTTPVDPAAAAPEPEVRGETAAPTRRNVAQNAANGSDTGGSGKQFVFFVLTAAVIGTAAGFARNRLITSRTV